MLAGDRTDKRARDPSDPGLGVAPRWPPSLARDTDFRQTIARIGSPQAFYQYQEVLMDARIAVRPVAAPFEAMIGPHYDGLVRRLAFIVGDAEEAKDLAQGAYLRAFEAWPRFEGFDARGWLYTIGINLAVSERRRRSRWRRHAPVVEQEWAMTVDPDLWRAIGALE